MRLICCFYWRWNVQICLMGGESGRMFPFTLQTPTRHPCLYISPSNTHKHQKTHGYWRIFTCAPSRLCGSQQLLLSGIDMRGSMGKLVFRRKRTGQVSLHWNALPLKLRDKLHTQRTAAQSHRLSFHSVRRESGSKWEDARPSSEGGEIILHTPPWQKSTSAFGLLTKGNS